ncbi:MAG TPA: ribosome assembly RNA-binding protein YhbY [Mobilitalea sp.]|nr:ribosome assembly RNA-binding protein YhbY [Mobilitalea sp.]
MTAKQRAYLKGLAMTMDPIYQIGKSALTPEITEGISDALEARELVKINVLKNCTDDINEMAHILSERTHSELVQVIGKKIVLYRESKDKKRIILPEDKKSKVKA